MFFCQSHIKHIIGKSENISHGNSIAPNPPESPQSPADYGHLIDL